MLFFSAYNIFLFSNLPTLIVAFASPSYCPNKFRSSRFGVWRERRVEQKCQQESLKLPIFEATKSSQDSVFSRYWYPNEEFDDDSRRDLEEKSIELATVLVRHLLSKDRYIGDADDMEETGENSEDAKIQNCSVANQKAYELATGKFVDFCGDRKGENLLESLFLRTGETEIGRTLFEEGKVDDHIRYRKVVSGAVIAIQSLLVLGMTYGLTMNPKGVSRTVGHMKEDAEALDINDTIETQQWTPSHTLRLKYKALSDNNADEKIPGLQLLTSLKFKRTPLGAYNVLIRMGVWGKHENLTLLRSGFPIRFTASEEDIAHQVAIESNTSENYDPDKLLGIRCDFRSQKIYTIDSASTKEIDDGLGVEIVYDESGKKNHRYWIHIADADRWAPRKSKLFEIARRRATSIYLPGTSIPMMPSSVGQQIMSLIAHTDVCALSLGVELNDDGSIIDDSIIVTPSTVRVNYRLTYDDADEMLEDGVGYNEEWELGQLFTTAQKRRKYRMDNGSAEAFVPTQIPQYTISTFFDGSAPDNVGIKVDVQVSHNGGKNQSSVALDSMMGRKDAYDLSNELPVSSSSTLVTEMMILAGEAIGKWSMNKTKTYNDGGKSNSLELPFRSQDKPDYRSREKERKIMVDLLEHNIGDGYCHAWYSRRFLTPAKVSPEANPHSGLGLDCYVQWTSPIRRFQDLQVHATVKRFIRRQKIIDLLKIGKEIPSEITSADLGCELSSPKENGAFELNLENVDRDIDFSDKTNLLRPAQFVMRNSNKFWMLEHIRRIKETDPQRTLEVLVLGCINPSKKQYAIFLYELGMEWRYNSPVGIQAGDRFKARIGNVLPQNGQMTLVRLPNGSI